MLNKMDTKRSKASNDLLFISLNISHIIEIDVSQVQEGLDRQKSSFKNKKTNLVQIVYVFHTWVIKC